MGHLMRQADAMDNENRLNRIFPIGGFRRLMAVKGPGEQGGRLPGADPRLQRGRQGGGDPADDGEDRADRPASGGGDQEHQDRQGHGMGWGSGKRRRHFHRQFPVGPHQEPAPSLRSCLHGRVGAAQIPEGDEYRSARGHET